MNAAQVFVRHDAEVDALGCFEYIRDYSPAAAIRFLQSMDEPIEGLALQPRKGRLRKFSGRDLKDIRSWP